MKDRIKHLQDSLGVPDDGVIGPVTLTAIEQRLKLKPTDQQDYSLVVSRASLAFILRHEGFRARPYVPSKGSGVTIGFGYDLGHQSSAQIARDWGDFVSLSALQVLQHLATYPQSGSTVDEIEREITEHAGVKISRAVAEQVFYYRTLPRYAKDTRRAYPGVEFLPHDAQGALLSLVYNRGTSKKGDSQHEMKDLGSAIKAGDLEAIAQLIESMKRLWVGKGAGGLLKRRDDEADLVRVSKRKYATEELVRI